MRKDKAGSEVSLFFEFKIIDRASSAITPPYEAIGQAARSSEVNHINETSESKKNVLQWLWVMTNTMVAFFMSHPKDAAGWKESSHASGSFGKRGLAPTNNHAERILRCGESAPGVPQVKRATAGWKESCPSDIPAGCSPGRFFPH